MGIKFATDVGKMLIAQRKKKVFMPLMYVHYQFTGCAMSMSARITISLAINAKLDTGDKKVSLTSKPTYTNLFANLLCASIVHKQD
ncbi:hypothetical protein Hanom_Chr13g01210851 [Helianthus anomalus]